MNDPFENVDAVDVTRWINTAVEETVKKIIVFWDDFDDNMYPHYLLEGEKEAEIIEKTVTDTNMQHYEGTADVKEEIQKAINDGEAGINYKEALKLFPDLVY